MVRMLALDAHPMVALATPPGLAGVAVLRLSGPPGLLELVLPLLRLPNGRPLTPAHLPPRTLRLAGWHETPDTPALDQVLVVHFPAPNSFTGEEMVELHTHGAPMVVARILELLYQQGIQAAQPGEFTRRACQNGKMDLVQAEALPQLLAANSLAVAREASRQLSGSLSHTLHGLRTLLLDALVHLEATLDFSDEEISPDDHQAIAARLDQASRQMDDLLATGELGRFMSEGYHLVIAGPPNVGKSSLFNRLVGREKAIVTPLAGTTRDLNETTLMIAGLPVCLVDTAGLRESDDLVETIGITRARQRLDQADGVLLVLAAGQPDPAPVIQDFSHLSGVVVWNKGDLQPAGWQPPPSPWPGVVISCTTGQGLDTLHQAIVNLLTPIPTEGGGILMAERHRQGVTQARRETALAQATLSPELASLHLRAALVRMEELVGTVTDQDLLNGIFSRFCIGK